MEIRKVLPGEIKRVEQVCRIAFGLPFEEHSLSPEEYTHRKWAVFSEEGDMMAGMNAWAFVQKQICHPYFY